MSNGLDQYLADRLTRDHVLQVVTDPKVADAVITDKLGTSFEDLLLKARPELKPPPPPKPVKKKKDGDDDSAEDIDTPEQEPMMPVSSFQRARGTVFVVHAHSQQVVWSTFQRPSSRKPKDMERAASKIAKSIELTLHPPVKK